MNAPEKEIETMPVAPLSQEEQRHQRRRSLAIALALGVLAVIFFVVTIVRIGSSITNQAI